MINCDKQIREIGNDLLYYVKRQIREYEEFFDGLMDKIMSLEQENEELKEKIEEKEAQND